MGRLPGMVDVDVRRRRRRTEEKAHHYAALVSCGNAQSSSQDAYSENLSVRSRNRSRNRSLRAS